ncbi:MAG: DUF2806 domain-containing protein [Burkholderiales bacterium]|nr:DUF2806 domain-containing protein [Burkholderiales bacterium]
MSFPVIVIKGKAAEKLVDALDRGIGGIYRPIGTMLNAAAERQARKIKAKTNIEIKEMRERAKHRLDFQEVCRQENIESIVSKTANMLSDNVDDKDIEQDWLTQFFAIAQDVSDDGMQTLWAKILSGEIAKPGSYAKRTIDFLRTLEKTEAEGFSMLCSFAFTWEDGWPFLFENNVTRERTYPLAWMEHFASIGLLAPAESIHQTPNLIGRKIKYFEKGYLICSSITQLVESTSISLAESPMGFDGNNYYTPQICGARNFSAIGKQLAAIAGGLPKPEYVDDLVKAMSAEWYLSLKEL